MRLVDANEGDILERGVERVEIRSIERGRNFVTYLRDGAPNRVYTATGDHDDASDPARHAATDWTLVSIVVKDTRDWPNGGARTLNSVPGCHTREKRGHHSFVAQFDPGDNEVWFWITAEACGRMRETTTTARERGSRLVDALVDWVGRNPEHTWTPRNDFRVRVSDDGRDTAIESYEPVL